MIILRRTFALLATLMLAAYLGACAWLWFRQDGMLFFPEAGDADLGRQYADYELTFDVNEHSLQGWYFPGSLPTTLIYYGGNGEELSVRLPKLRELGDYGLLMVNYRGFGESSGFPSEQGLKTDALAIFDEAIDRFDLEPQQTVLIGRSLGSGVAACVAAERESAGLILVTPYDSILSMARERYPAFPVKLLLRHPFDTVACAADVTEPTLIVYSTVDAIVPHPHTDSLVEQWPGQPDTVTLPGNHATVVDSTAFDTALRQYIDRVTEQDLLAGTEANPDAGSRPNGNRPAAGNAAF